MNNLYTMHRILFSSLISLTVALSMFYTNGSALAASSVKIHVHFIRSADCTGEDVEISGMVQVMNKTQTDSSLVSHFNYQNLRGIGLTSGTTYQVSAVDHIRLSAPFPSSIHSLQSFHLISRGSASNLLVHVLYHITVNANGEVSASIDEFSMQCTQ